MLGETVEIRRLLETWDECNAKKNDSKLGKNGKSKAQKRHTRLEADSQERFWMV